MPQPSTSTDSTNLGHDNSCYHAQPHPIILECTAYTYDQGLTDCIVGNKAEGLTTENPTPPPLTPLEMLKFSFRYHDSQY